MIGKHLVFTILGSILLGFGIASGLALLRFSILQKEKSHASSYLSTLWGLFIICTIAGIIIFLLL